MDSSTTPLVSVIMPAYNAERYLRTAVESVLQQTFTDFEFIIINDGSTDRTENILQSYKDPRIKVIYQEQSGLVPTLNRLLNLAQGQFIARMDADDQSAPTRLAEQVLWFQKNPNGILVGSWTTVIDESGNKVKNAIYPVSDSFCKIALCSGNAFAHGAVMFRRNDCRYRQEYNFAEDYELWHRLARLGKIGNIPSFLYSWRSHNRSISHQNKKQQKEINKKIQLELRENNLIPKYSEILSDVPLETKERDHLRTVYSLFRYIRNLNFSEPQRIFRFVWLSLQILLGSHIR